MRNQPLNLVLIVSVCVLGALAHWCQQQVEKRLKLSDTSPSALVPTAASVRLVSLGFEQVIADYYWLQFIYYVGDSKARDLDHYEHADRYLDLITGLDPRIIQAYWFAAFTVGGDQKNPERAAELIERGLQANQDNWYLPYIAAVNQFLFARNTSEAARYYRMAAKYKGAPDWLERQATILDSNIPVLAKSANIWLNVFNSAEDDTIRERARITASKLWSVIYNTAPTDKIRIQARKVLILLLRKDGN
ncbi:MAG: hypothetical protein K2Z81_28635 [Cyanobacteria bacterium]|nr:hypothetical protein [Cyanobacteriota bacterium]